jgi:hypothetical protein
VLVAGAGAADAVPHVGGDGSLSCRGVNSGPGRRASPPKTRGRRTFYGQLDHHRRGGRGTPASAAGTAASPIIVVRRRPRARLPAMWMESGVAISGQGQPESARNNGEWAHQGRGARHHYDGEDSFLLALGMMGLIAVDEYDRRQAAARHHEMERISASSSDSVLMSLHRAGVCQGAAARPGKRHSYLLYIRTSIIFEMELCACFPPWVYHFEVDFLCPGWITKFAWLTVCTGTHAAFDCLRRIRY